MVKQTDTRRSLPLVWKETGVQIGLENFSLCRIPGIMRLRIVFVLHVMLLAGELVVLLPTAARLR